MRKTFILRFGMISIIALSPVACKKKQVTPVQKSTDSQAPFLKSDQWQGTEDQIDPQMGKIKTLD